MSHAHVVSLVVCLLATPALAQEPASPADTPPATAPVEPDDVEELRRLVEEQRRMLDYVMSNRPAPATPPVVPDPMNDFATWQRVANVVPYHEGESIPAWYERTKVRNRGAIVSGATLLGTGWFIGTLAAALDQDFDRSGTLIPMYVPVVGPWIAMGLDGARGDLSPAGGWGIALDGVVQAVGLGVLTWGLTHKKEVMRKRPFGVTGVSLAPDETGMKAGLSGTF